MSQYDPMTGEYYSQWLFFFFRRINNNFYQFSNFSNLLTMISSVEEIAACEFKL
jgi:hypothetical protein